MTRLETIRPPAALAQIAARWLLPVPSAPTMATARAGQSGQRSIRASAAALPGPDRKSSRIEAFAMLKRKGKLPWRRGTRRAHHASRPE